MNRSYLTLGLVLGLLCSCSDPPPLCNGLEGLCDRTVAEVVWPGTHNSHASQDQGYDTLANQHVDIPTQLRDGIRSLNMDLYVEEGELLACHLICSLASQPAEALFAQLKTFLIDHPDEVLLLTFQADGIDPFIAEAMEAQGLADYALVHDPTEPWPTLASLIGTDQRLIVFTSEGGEPAWLHSVEAQITRTNYAYNTVEDFDCALRNESEGSLFQMSHHLYDPVASPELAALANEQAVLEARIQLCEAELGRSPNILVVDYYDLGDLLVVSDEINSDL